MVNLKNKIVEILNNTYPIKKSFNELNNLSHFYIISSDWGKFLFYNIDIKGNILNSEYQDYKIIKVITNKKKIYDWNDYLVLYVSFLNNYNNPCINENNFLYLLHTFNYIDDLNIKKIMIKKNTNILNIDTKYTKDISYNLTWNNNISTKIIDKENHFYLYSFDVNSNHEKLKKEISRLIKNRDKYNNIHFHLDNNGGGDLVPVHLIIRCLVGTKEKWMKNIKKILMDKTILEWDCWNEENKNSPNYKTVNKLNLDTLPNYQSKYNGKIYLHMDKQNGSATWFFITYLIYAFGGKINRYHKKCYGKVLKFGNLVNKNSQLIIKGHSGTTSGDGNSISIKYKNIYLNCPTEQFLSCSVKENDWNRFWIE
jgi:hypothetical protein